MIFVFYFYFVSFKIFGSLKKYSGGQASEGQGGFYGSGGARAGADPAADDDPASSTTNSVRTKMVALTKNIETIRTTMDEVEEIEEMIRDKHPTTHNTDPSMIEAKHKLKKLCTSVTFVEALNNVFINNEPVWGLSTSERELILLARDKMNEC
jgi:hypothetical protein